MPERKRPSDLFGPGCLCLPEYIGKQFPHQTFTRPVRNPEYNESNYGVGVSLDRGEKDAR